INEYEIFLFGSRASDLASDRSDIDIGILSKEPLPLATLNDIKSDIEEIKTLYSIDIVDFASAADDFKEVALKKRILIGEKGIRK
ncbi:nucleotidyltransferase domain-containing protein, partial [bacterium]|nr:nucleotidyltransferase domain-containing protein [bacterium]